MGLLKLVLLLNAFAPEGLWACACTYQLQVRAPNAVISCPSTHANDVADST